VFFARIGEIYQITALLFSKYIIELITIVVGGA